MRNPAKPATSEYLDIPLKRTLFNLPKTKKERKTKATAALLLRSSDDIVPMPGTRSEHFRHHLLALLSEGLAGSGEAKRSLGVSLS